MKKERLGIFGGTFNPPHIGHRHAAEAFVREAALDLTVISLIERRMSINSRTVKARNSVLSELAQK